MASDIFPPPKAIKYVECQVAQHVWHAVQDLHTRSPIKGNGICIVREGRHSLLIKKGRWCWNEDHTSIRRYFYAHIPGEPWFHTLLVLLFRGRIISDADFALLDRERERRASFGKAMADLERVWDFVSLRGLIIDCSALVATVKSLAVPKE